MSAMQAKGVTTYHEKELRFNRRLPVERSFTGQNKIQIKIFKPGVILNFLCFLALIIHELGLGDKGN